MAKREQVSDIPKASTIKFKTPQVDTLSELMQRMSLLAEERGHETIEEADDFDIGDDYDPTSPWEEHFNANGESLGFLATGIKKDTSRIEQISGGEAEPKEGVEPPADLPAD